MTPQSPVMIHPSNEVTDHQACIFDELMQMNLPRNSPSKGVILMHGTSAPKQTNVGVSCYDALLEYDVSIMTHCRRFRMSTLVVPMARVS